jgi:predicted transcriptional regulator
MDAAQMVRYVRQRAGLTQRALAAKAAVPQPAIARIESGAVQPRLDTVLHLLDAAGFTLEVSPKIGRGVDRSLIRAALERTPEERIMAATVAARNLRGYLEATDEQAQ